MTSKKCNELCKHFLVVDDGIHALFTPQGYTLIPSCPNIKDIKVDSPLDIYFGEPWNNWYVGKVLKTYATAKAVGGSKYNLSAEFTDEEGEVTKSNILADSSNYGAEKTWVLLNPVEEEDSDSSRSVMEVE